MTLPVMAAWVGDPEKRKKKKLNEIIDNCPPM
jgi:hypothetical protein